MNILVFAPHPDDEVLGVGGTMLRHIKEGDKVYVCVVTRPVEPIFPKELFDIIRPETIRAHEFMKITKTFFLELPTCMLETVLRYEFNKKVQEVIDEVSPDVLYIPHFGDMQKDHGLVAEAVLVAARPKASKKISRIYAYETLSETEWNAPNVKNAFIPNVYVDITDFIDKKLEAMSHFRSQLAEFPNPRSLKAIEALSNYRGSTILSKSAEAFMLIREIR